MGDRFRRPPSPAMAVAFVALLAALGGTAVALPGKNSVKKDDIARGAVNTTDIRNSTVRTQDIRNSTIRGKDVRDNTLTGSDVNEGSLGLRTSSSFNEDASDIASLGGTFVNVVSTTITTQSQGRILASGSAEIGGTGTSEGQCQIVIDGSDSLDYEGSPDDIGAPDPQTIAVNFAVTRPAGTYTASLQCRADTGAVTKDDAAISVYGLGA